MATFFVVKQSAPSTAPIRILLANGEVDTGKGCYTRSLPQPILEDWTLVD